MAGYSGYSKSNNALAAEADGLMVASVAAKCMRGLGVKGCTAKAIAAAFEPSEWHHSSKMYNSVDYFDLRGLVVYLEKGAWDVNSDWADAGGWSCCTEWRSACNATWAHLVKVIALHKGMAKLPDRITLYMDDGSIWYGCYRSNVNELDFARYNSLEQTELRRVANNGT